MILIQSLILFFKPAILDAFMLACLSNRQGLYLWIQHSDLHLFQISWFSLISSSLIWSKTRSCFTLCFCLIMIPLCFLFEFTSISYQTKHLQNNEMFIKSLIKVISFLFKKIITPYVPLLRAKSYIIFTPIYLRFYYVY